MKNKITLALLLAITSFSGWSQSVSFTSVPTSTPIGTYITINYKYTLASAGRLVCGINLFNDWTYISTVGYAELNPAVAGTDVTGTFTILIPSGTTPTASLTGLQNYKINLELKDASNNYLTGDYSVQNYNFTAAPVIPAISFTSVPTSTPVGTNLVINYKYTAPAAGGKVVCGINLFDDWTYISTVNYAELNPAVAGTDVTGTFTVLIPSDTTPTTSLTGLQNYKIGLELKDASDTWLAGDFNQNYNLTPSSLGINDFDYNKLSVYPNPVENVLKIDNTKDLSNLSFRIVNVAGQTVQKSKILNDEGINVSGLKTGIYFLSVNSENGSKQIKFIKK
jgi:hypothetical protein